MRSPTRLRIFSNGWRAALSSAAEIELPREASAARSNGQIFMAVMPSPSSSSARSSARVKKRIEVVVVAVLAQPPVGAALAGRLAHVLGAGAGVVGADAVAREAAEELGDRLAGGLAEEVPERDVDGRIATGFGAGGPEADIADKVAGNQVDGQRIAAEEQRRGGLVDVRLHRARPEERLAKAGDPGVGVDLHPQQVGVFRDADCLDFGDLHVGLVSQPAKRLPGWPRTPGLRAKRLPAWGALARAASS